MRGLAGSRAVRQTCTASATWREVTPRHTVTGSKRLARGIHTDARSERLDLAYSLVAEAQRHGQLQPFEVQFGPPHVQVTSADVGKQDADYNRPRLGLGDRVFAKLERLLVADEDRCGPVHVQSFPVIQLLA